MQLGFGGSFADQGQPETEQERKRRLAALQAAQAGIAGRVGAGYGAALSVVGSGLGLNG